MRAFVGLAILVSGCAPPAIAFVPTRMSSPLGVNRSHVAPMAVQLFDCGAPLPPFEEIGYLEADDMGSRGPANFAGLRELLVQAAAAHGCDGLILHEGCRRRASAPASSPEMGWYRFAVLPATCVRFDDPW